MTEQDIFLTLRGLIAEQFALEPENITMESNFADDFAADSVDLVELVMSLEEEFDIGEINEEDLSELTTVGKCVHYLAAKLNG